jgi:hypothetical protein
MIFKYKKHNLDLDKITRLYPAALITIPNEEATQVSLEWAEIKKDKITIEAYMLIFDFDPIGEIPVNRVELKFNDKKELDLVVNNLAVLLK